MASSYAPIAERIRALYATQKELRAEVKLLRSVRALVRPRIRPLNAAHRTKFLRWAPNVTTSGNKDHFEVEIYGSAIDMEGFKDKRLLKLLSKFLDADKTETKDYAESLTRYFYFTYRPDPKLTIKVTLSTTAKSDSSTCQRVLKSSSVRVVDVKEYEIVCSA
jgi:hypothetical protein